MKSLHNLLGNTEYWGFYYPRKHFGKSHRSPAGPIPPHSSSELPILPWALESCILRLSMRDAPAHRSVSPRQPDLQDTPSLSGVGHLYSPPEDLLLLEIPTREVVHQAPWETAEAGFLFIFKMLTTPLCPWMVFLLWAFLSALVKLNHFVTRQEPGPALSLQTQQQLILPLQLLAATHVPTACNWCWSAWRRDSLLTARVVTCQPDVPIIHMLNLP